MKKIMLSVLALSFVVGLTGAQASGIEKADFSSELKSPMNKVLINRPFRVSPIGSWRYAQPNEVLRYNPFIPAPNTSFAPFTPPRRFR
jgi:hypothetical protein